MSYLSQRSHQLAANQLSGSLGAQVCPRRHEGRRLQPRARAPVVVIAFRPQPVGMIRRAIHISRTDEHRAAIRRQRQRYFLCRCALLPPAHSRRASPNRAHPQPAPRSRTSQSADLSATRSRRHRALRNSPAQTHRLKSRPAHPCLRWHSASGRSPQPCESSVQPCP